MEQLDRSKETEDLNTTINQNNLIDMYRTHSINNNSIHTLLKYSLAIFQDRLYVRPQIKASVDFILKIFLGVDQFSSVY